MRRADRRRMVTAAATGGWCAVFGALHAYWGLGGRYGLGATTAEADAALATGWFATYYWSVTALALAGVAAACAAAQARIVPRLVPLLKVVSTVAAATLLARGVLGMVLLVASMAQGREPMPPWALVRIEPFFIVGGVSFWSLRRSLPQTAPAGRP